MGKGSAATPERIDLFEYSEEQLLEEKELTHYQILNVPEYASQDEIKKAYRRTSLKYHPDKTGRGDDDYVFLAVKQAHDTLFDNAKRQAYDSTVIPFDDHIPAPRASLLQDPLLLYKDDDFYDTFGPVFQRNLRFDLRLRPDLNKKSATGGRNSNSSNNKSRKPPSLGHAETPIEQVHAFYEYWIHFESWRDFSTAAADELQMEQNLENAESRYEKRWYQKEIDKRAKQLKRQEMGRISTLVERAMEADPRLREERAEKLRQKEEAAAARQRQKELAEEEKLKEQMRQEQLEKEQEEQAAQEKLEREKEKKLLRKARQQLRRMASASFENSGSNNGPAESSARDALWDDAYDMQQDVEFLCANLDMDEINTLSNELESKAASENLKLLHERAVSARQNAAEGEEEQQQQQQQVTASAKSANDKKNSTRSGNSSKNPWTKEELSALAKAVKKYPPGGSSRWDQICLFVNNLCRQAEPRTKEECIEQYNQVARGNRSGCCSDASTAFAKSAGTSSTAPRGSSVSSGATTATTSTGSETNANNEGNTTSDTWTPAQDQQLQDALAQFPASMDKNERWSSIAATVGKSKKQCVARFKAIREALKKSKK